MKDWGFLAVLIVSAAIISMFVSALASQSPRDCYSAPLPSAHSLVQGPGGPMLCTTSDTPAGSVLECRYLQKSVCR